MNDEKKTQFINIREAVSISGIGIQTIRKLCDTNKITCYKTPSGQRKINKSSLEQMCNIVHDNEKVSIDSKENYIYSRVSSKKQMDDLSRQTNFIRTSDPKYESYVSITDIASGINFKRKGLWTILDSALQGTLGEVVIAHKDRLSRSAFDLIQCIIEKSGGNITILDDEKNKTSSEELAEELLSIIHVYSCKEMEKRRYK
jgi:predicted site-specific integrase-resolvase